MPNYLVQVYRESQEEPQLAALYEGIFVVVLNICVHFRFVPAVDESAPPWPADQEPPADEFTTAEQMRWYELTRSRYCVSFSQTRAGRVEALGPLQPPSVVFYVTPAEFMHYTGELTQLADMTGEPGVRLHRDTVLDRDVMRLIDERILGRPGIDPGYARAVGREVQPEVGKTVST